MDAAANDLDHSLPDRRRQVHSAVRRQALVPIAILVLVLGYLTYTWTAFDVTGLIASAQPERAALLATDSVAHKVHVTKSLRNDAIAIAIEWALETLHATEDDEFLNRWYPQHRNTATLVAPE